MNKTEEFIEKAKKVHGDIYDYSKVNYINSNTKVKIICLSHGVFDQLPYAHLSGTACNKCGYKKMVDKIKSNTEEFIEKARLVHGYKYNYFEVNYINCKTNVTIICPIHGRFYQKPSCHLSNHGCNKCWLETPLSSKKSNSNEFIEKAKKVHGEKYDYSKIDYINSNTKVTIICSIHGEFNQVPYSHLIGNGCKECGHEKGKNKCKSNTEEFIEKAKNIHGDIYDYSKVEYININEKIIIICKNHGEFNQTPKSHLKQNGCPLCVNKTEGKLYQELIKIYPSLITQFRQKWCKNIRQLPFDFCIPEYNIIIELDGTQHFIKIGKFAPPEEQFKNDKYKELCANKNNYSTIRLLQKDVFNNTYDWLTELCETIEIIRKQDIVTNVYLCKNNKYEKYKSII